ncbi:phosphotyrosine protein phosphatase [Corynebacterium sp. ES2794-CONJ1]|uniref:arsenate-mycothiol transferase ArsC n=1 Tax=unclassified Corynebacterium TaxID=2624378 RepID=UPI002169F904|nr:MULTISPECIES: phosphotyrosine protein phosphatase [unclassified Corynebacterium]MCS4490164.1 phosphotyrosine protein phosphatase [Corynebacterium sp. ES2775-CONJ]MCS4492024.1 phosphotyrosine protein phosphatase [Corynebacterium sp. ES2715-CONJ3]MCS4532129.1 phosphotyrosine protein phosphatase [Corynebacterium sp. ES2730-CONJ]MCU9519531.1 phosphotyrosine protein phosphatase [Corynebacterium sp. ES2794-CONJ1]
MSFMNLTSTKLSNRWGEIFSNFLGGEEQPPRPVSPESEPQEDLSVYLSRSHSATQPTGTTHSILFVSADNAARTQIASAYTRYLGGENVFVRSVGTDPQFMVEPMVIEVLQERGIPTVDLKPKTFNPHTVDHIETIVSFDEEAVTGSHHWVVNKDVSSPKACHQMCDQIEANVRNLLEECGIEPRPHGKLIPEFMAA